MTSKNLQPNLNYLYVGGVLVASEKTMSGLKSYVKNNYESPKKNIKGYVIRIKYNDKGTSRIVINCTQVTITPKLNIKISDDDNFQVFTYSENDIKNYKFNISILKKIMHAMKNIDVEKSKIPISDLFNDKVVEKNDKVNKHKITFFEYLEPREDSGLNDHHSKETKLIMEQIIKELNKIIDMDKMIKIENQIPSDLLEKILKWTEKKKEGQIHYSDFVKKVIYNTFLKSEFKKLNVNTFDGIIVSNLIAHDSMLRNKTDNNDKYHISETLFNNGLPHIPKKEIPTELFKLIYKYHESREYHVGKK